MIEEEYIVPVDKIIRFKLSQSFLEEYIDRDVEWGYGVLSYITYKRTYARQIDGEERTEEWWETCTRVIEGMFTIQKAHCKMMGLPWDNRKAQRSAQEAYERLFTFKWTPPGRGLWCMGTEFVYQRGGAALNNCLARETEIITDKGVKKIGELVGKKVNLLTENGKWVEAPIRSFGKQKLMKIVFSRAGSKKTVYATPDHRWFCVDRRAAYRNKGYCEFLTKDLRPGIHRVQEIYGNKSNLKPSPFGVAHGFTFGDGTKTKNERHANFVKICGEKDKFIKKYLFCEDGKDQVGGLPNYFKELPDINENSSYLYGWLQGYFAADGSCDKNGQIKISSSKKKSLEFFRDTCVKLGIGTFSIREEERVSNLTNEKHIMYNMGLMSNTLDEDFFLCSDHKKNFVKKDKKCQWYVESVEETDRCEEVFCATVQEYGKFALADNILTGNCAFVSSENISTELAEPFLWNFTMSMYGVGVGFDTKGANTVTITEPRRSDDIHVVVDSREGWADAIRRCINAFSGLGSLPDKWDFSKVREKGEPIKGFGGVASGPDPLELALTRIESVLGNRIGEKITESDIVDIMNICGACVVAGGIRRTAQIAFGKTDEFMDLKLDKQKVMDWRWASNNSIFAELGQDYSRAADRTAVNGEPGYAWLENMRAYGRMKDGKNWKDYRVAGGNPCFAPDTLIAVADGRGAVTIKELAEEGKDVAVYSLNKEGKVEIKWGRRPRKTRSGAELVRVHLEDGSHIDVTPNHNMILLNGDRIEAKDLKPGDSLPRLVKRFDKISKNNPNRYIRTHCNTRIPREDKIFEHRLIAEFFDLDTYNEMYDENKQNGWIKGGLVVHHKDYDPQNNSPDNLEWMTFKDHCSLHAVDRSGEKNGMFGKEHSDETKDLIGQNTKERWQDPEERQKILDGQKEYYENGGSEEMSRHMSALKKEWDYEYYLECEKETDLDTIWEGKRLFVKKECKQTGEEFIVSWGKRDQMFASYDAYMQYMNENYAEKRKENQAKYFEDRQRDILHKQVMIYKDLQKSLDRDPLKKEWENACRNKDVPFRLNKHSGNPHVLASYRDLKKRAKNYNHRVAKVEKLGGEHDVYNLTVDDNFTVGVITKKSELQWSGILLAQCLEQSLEDHELCCLVESYPARHDSFEDYKRTLKFAYLYAKTVTLVPTHDKLTNAVMMRNRRIGCSMSGIMQNIELRGLHEHLRWCDDGYEEVQRWDKAYSEWMCVPRSIKSTSVKPSGTVSLLAGATPGIHAAHSEFIIRRVRIAETSPLWRHCKAAGYHVEPDEYSENTMVVEFPIHDPLSKRCKKDLTIWEQVNLAALHQHYWADNQVSCTVNFEKEEADQIQLVLEAFQDKLKGISFLPMKDHGFVQAPYEEIDSERYQELISKIDLNYDFNQANIIHDKEDKFCDGEACEIDLG